MKKFHFKTTHLSHDALEHNAMGSLSFQLPPGLVYSMSIRVDAPVKIGVGAFSNQILKNRWIKCNYVQNNGGLK